MSRFTDAFIKINEIAHPEQIWICFHYLGGSASVYYSWKTKISNNVQLYAAQLPGRENRRNEAFFCDIQRAIDHYFNMLISFDFICPFIFYGHSMGALIAYELMLKMEQLSSLPLHQLVISACKAPQCIYSKGLHHYSDDYLINQLHRYGGTPKLILEDKTLLNFFLPRLKADTEMLDSYCCQKLTPLQCPIFALGGQEDNYVPVEYISKWSDCTISNFQQKIYPGGHFFINTMRTEIIRDIYQVSHLCFQNIHKNISHLNNILFQSA